MRLHSHGSLSWLPLAVVVSVLVFRAHGPEAGLPNSGDPTSYDPESGLRSAYLMREWQQRGVCPAVGINRSQNELLKTHFDEVLRRLVRDTHESLDTALQRLQLYQGSRWTPAIKTRWRDALLARRIKNIRRLAQYRNRGRFPQNEACDHATPIFVDRHGTACAVGYLMCRSGHVDDVRSIANSDNLVFVTDTNNRALHQWILHAGLTREEAALIQPTYIPPLEHTLSDLVQGGSDQEGALLYENFSFEVNGAGQFAGPATSGVETRSVVGPFRSPDYIRIGSRELGGFAQTAAGESLTVSVGYDVSTINDQLIDRVDLIVHDGLINARDLFGTSWAEPGGRLTLTTDVLAGDSVLGTISGEAVGKDGVEQNERMRIAQWLTFPPQTTVRIENTFTLEGPALATAFVNGIHLSPDLTLTICDIDHNGACDIDDLEQLITVVRQGSQDLRYDINDSQHVSKQDIQHWLDIKHVYPGDANLDFFFNSSDLVHVFRAGQYEDDTPGNSNWSTGDWNLDGEFTSSDLTYVFRHARYEGEARPAVPAIPEPTSLAALLTGLIGLAIVSNCRRRRV